MAINSAPRTTAGGPVRDATAAPARDRQRLARATAVVGEIGLTLWLLVKGVRTGADLGAQR